MCLLIRRLRTLVFTVIIEKCIFLSFCCFCILGFLLFKGCLGLVNFSAPNKASWVCGAFFLVWNITPSILCGTGLVVIDSLSLLLSWKVGVSPLVLIDSFFLGMLGWIGNCDLSEFKIHLSKSSWLFAASLMGLPVHVTWPFFVADFHIPSLFYILF